MSDRARCGICGSSRPVDETALVPGRRSGNYRRASASATRRVCRDCTIAHVDFVRRAQSERRQTPLDEHHVSWFTAAQRFGIDVADVWRNDYDRRKREEQAAAD